MPIEIGQVVLCLAGRDKGQLMVVLNSANGQITLADGKSRPLDRPKTKNLKHVQVTAHRLNISEMATDRGLRRALNLLLTTDL